MPHLARIDEVPENEWTPLEAADMGDADFRYPVKDHWLTNPIARASEVMAELSKNSKLRSQAPMAAE